MPDPEYRRARVELATLVIPIGPGQPRATFGPELPRTKVTKGHGSKAAALGMAFKLIESAQRRRMVNASHLVALVRAGATFVNGKLVERPAEDAARAA